MSTADRVVDLDNDALELSADEVLVDLDKPLDKEGTKESVKKTVSKEYEDKSAEELVAMNAAAQKQISRQGNEIGELRKLTDQILQQQLDKKTTAKPTETDDELDWDYDTQGSVEKVVDSRVKALEEKIVLQERQTQFSEFERQHPDWNNTSQEEKFLDWVAKSKYRSRLYSQAHNHDYAAADDLFTEYADLNKATEEQEHIDDETKSKERKSQLRDASLEKGGSSGTTKKVYSRRALIALKLSDPAKYDSMADDIYKAYAEGRVK